MKKTGLFLLLLAALLLFAPTALTEGEADPPDEWTVLFYFCGSDLESKYSYATGNLEEISSVAYPQNYLSVLVDHYDVSLGEFNVPGKVNILIETGGAKEWHAERLGMDIRADALQRWRYNYGPVDAQEIKDIYCSFELMETLPLQSMAQPDTLADFIRWGVETYPAKKYALVLWDHGNGATGLFIDELFDNEMMYLSDLRLALSKSGAHFEAVIIDACLMANMETAWSLKAYADWMVASEEIVPGKGTAISDWLQQLVYNPTCGGSWLGRTVCDVTLIKYANEADEQARSILTWSVIDLSKIDALIEVCGSFFDAMNDALRYYPALGNLYARFIFEAEEYGDGQESMRDFASVAYNTKFANTMDANLRSSVLKALSDAVVYSVRGPGRSGARGLSFCYPTDFSAEELDIYARNFPMPAYLAYLDAISDWEAPDWVFAYTEPVPDIDSIEEFRVTAVKKISENGMPALDMTESLLNIDDVYYRLYRFDKETGEMVRLGRTNCGYEMAEHRFVLYRATDPLHWPAVDGILFCMDLIQTHSNQKLYNVPVQINSQNCILRCGRTVDYSDEGEKRINEYEIYGVWEGFEEDTVLLNRSVKPLSELAGQAYRFLYPVDGEGHNGGVNYQISQPLTMYRALEVAEVPLPEGTYYLEYEVDDMFMRSYLLDRIEFYWDGKSMTFPEDFVWEGEVVLNAK